MFRLDYYIGLMVLFWKMTFFIFWYSLFSPMYRQIPKEQSTKQIYRHAFHTKLMFAVYKKYLLKVWESDIMKCPASSVFNLGFFCSET